MNEIRNKSYHAASQIFYNCSKLTHWYKNSFMKSYLHMTAILLTVLVISLADLLPCVYRPKTPRNRLT